MQVRVYNCKDSHIKKLLRLGVEDYSERLFDAKIKNRVKISVILKDNFFEVDGDKDIEGYCEITKYNYKNQPREFRIQLVKSPLPRLFSALAHEVVHAWQFSHGYVDDDLGKWRGRRIPKHTDYWDEPWEVEAYGREPGLFARFKNKYNLQEFFKKNSNEKKYSPTY